MANFKEMNLGLDIGTNSIGWALLDENNNLIKKNGFTFWGVRMFEEASDSASRRTFRNSRRRLRRRKYRLNLLQEIFNDEISKEDPTFFERLEDSFYKQEDKKYNNYYNLFINEYTDKDFFNEFPTIYHLRKYLINSNKKEDIKFIYLACHNIIKYRGNFLHSGDVFNKSDNTALKEMFIDFRNLSGELSQKFDTFENDDYFMAIDLDYNDLFFSKLGEIINSRKGKNEKKKELMELFNVPKKSLAFDYLISLIVDSPVSFEKLPFIKDLGYDQAKLELGSCDDLENKLSEIADKCPEIYDLVMFTLRVKELIDHYYLLKLLSGYDYLCDAMVDQYNIHQSDLKELKTFIKNYAPQKFNEIFKEKSDNLNNYAKYVGLSTKNGKLIRFGHCKRNDFYKYLKSIFDSIKDPAASKDIKYFTEKMESNEFLLRQNSDQNGSIPMQLHLKELRKILDNQKKYYPFLEEVSDNISNCDKIISIFKFKIPYFVGPLNDKSEYAWLEKKINQPIKPWNLEHTVDIEQTAKNFIQRMQNKCTYLKGDDDYCLPKKSILYSEYNCWNYINKLQIDGALIDIETKKDLFEKVFLTKSKPTIKDIKNYFAAIGKKVDKTNEINCDMSSYVNFVSIFGKNFVDTNIDLIEKIISDITIFEDKTVLETRLTKLYNLDKNVVKKIKSLNYKDYGRLSKKLLAELRAVDENTGEVGKSIIEIMRETNLNFQEILFSDKYNFNSLIDEYNKGLKSDNQQIEDFIDENISINPGMRRAMIQSIRIIDEIEKIFGRKIDNYYIECTRSNKADKGEKGKKKSRYEATKELLKNCKDIANEFNIDLDELSSKLDQYQDRLQSDLLYLYFTQLGRCMYSLEPIDLEELIKSKNMYYDIDHIYPQSLIKDDSLSNRVLVKKQKNALKTDKFIFELNNFLNPDCCKFYEMLHEKALISREKMNRLLKKEMSQDELDGFVNRQLVSTNQAVKGLITVLKLYKNVNPTNIIYSKGENISDFRHEYGLVKSRTANNYHHAHDAYLNVVVGKALNDYYRINNFVNHRDFIRMRNENQTINAAKILSTSRIINGKKIWDFEKELGNGQFNENKELCGQIYKDLYYRFDVNETVMTYNSNQMLSKVTIRPAGSGTVAVKTNDKKADINKYGGIDSASYSKYIIIEEQAKNKKSIKIVPIPTMYLNSIDYYLKNKGYNNYIILIDNIKINELFVRGNTKSYLTGTANGGKIFLLKNAIDRNFDYKSQTIIKKIDSYFDNIKNGRKNAVTENKIIIYQMRDRDNEYSLTKEDIDYLYLKIRQLYAKDIFGFSPIKSILELLDCDINWIDKVQVIANLLSLLKTNERKIVDLSIVGGSKNAGTLTLGQTLNIGDKFIRKSYTGYYSNVIFEVKEVK